MTMEERLARPCKRGHLAGRRPSDARCRQCLVEKKRRYRAAHVGHSRPSSGSVRDQWPRKKAQEAGEATYLSWKPCRRGHTGPRRVDSASCLECLKVYWKGKRKEPRPVVPKRLPGAKLVCVAVYPDGASGGCKSGHGATRMSGRRCRECIRLRRAESRREAGLPERYYPSRDPARLAAQKAGLLTYLCGAPCGRCKSQERYVRKWRACVPCQKERSHEKRHGLDRWEMARMVKLQKGKCPLCLKKLTPGEYHIDHMFPRIKGGAGERGNLQITHPRCNLRKGGKDPIVYAQRSLGRLL